MSCKMDTNGSLCFNTAAAGCISRHQLVQFHNRMGPRAQRGLRCTVWQHKCHNSSFLAAVQYFIWSQQFVPVREHKIEAELIFWETASDCWTVHFSRQTLQWGKSHHPKRSYWEAALTQPWARLWTAYICRGSIHTEDDTASLQHCLISGTLHFKKRTKWCSANTVALWETFSSKSP